MQGMKSGLLLLLPPLALAGNHWNVTLPGGSMRFQGLIMASSCHVEAGDRQMTVNLGRSAVIDFMLSAKTATQSLSRFIYRIAVRRSASMWV